MSHDAHREQLVLQLGQLRSQIRDEVAIAALIIEPTKHCDRLVAGLLDSINNLEALLRAKL